MGSQITVVTDHQSRYGSVSIRKVFHHKRKWQYSWQTRTYRRISYLRIQFKRRYRLR